MSPLPFVPHDTAGFAILIVIALLGIVLFGWLAYTCRQI